MLDLETMGLSPHGAIASIGAVYFDPFGDALSDPFHAVVQLDGQEKLGRSFNGSTVTWWLSQERAAQQALLGAKLDLREALQQFTRYVGQQSVPCWAYGSTFDHVILRSAYEAAGLRSPLHYRDELCMRGLAKIAQVECPAVPGTAHNAVDDATRQARWLQSILKSMKGSK